MTDVALLAMFGAGLASFVSPCVLPLVPVWAGVSLGAAAGGASQTLRAAVPFVAGLSMAFATLGAAAGGAGGLVDGAGRWLPQAGGALTVVFGLTLLGRGPRWLRSEHRVVGGLRSAGRLPGAARSALTGVAVGAAWTPCAGPLLGAALTIAASQGGVDRGAALLGAYALGVGAPFIAAALALDAWPGITRSLARRARSFQLIGGAVLVVVGLALAAGVSLPVIEPAARLLDRL